VSICHSVWQDYIYPYDIDLQIYEGSLKAGFGSSEVDYNEIVLSSREVLVKVVDCDIFVGVSFKGNITYSDAALIKKAFFQSVLHRQVCHHCNKYKRIARVR